MTTSSLNGKPDDYESRKSWTNKDWFTHVGARENDKGQLCFGSTIAFSAMMQQFHRTHALRSSTEVAAPDLLSALKAALDNEEQRAFEAWLQRTTPSGDCDSVHSQWLESSDYEDFCSAWEKQLSAIAKATA